MVIGIVDKLKELYIEAECDALVAMLEIGECLRAGDNLAAVQAFANRSKAEKLARSINELVLRFDNSSSVGA